MTVWLFLRIVLVPHIAVRMPDFQFLGHVRFLLLLRRFEARFQKDVALIWNSCGINIAFEHRIGAEGTTRLAEALRTNTTLRSLDLTGPPVPFIRTSNILSNGLLVRNISRICGQFACVLHDSVSGGKNPARAAT